MKRITEYILLSVVIATSGFQYFYNNIEWVLIAAPITLLLAATLGVRLINFQALSIIAISLIWESFQLIYFGGFSLQSVIATCARMILAWTALCGLGVALVPRFIQFMTAFALVSLAFFGLMHIRELLPIMVATAESFSIPLFGELSEDYKHNTNIIVFNFHGYEFDPMRNSGPFWEPGAYAIFLSLSLTFMLMKGIPLFSWHGIIQIIALFTTFSTSGYITLFLILVFWAARSLNQLSNSIRLALRFTIIPILLFTIYQVVANVDFLIPKIQEDILLADETTSSRFGSALADIELIAKNPVIGYGRNMQAQYGTEIFDKAVMHRNNGLTRLIATWGIIGYVYLIFVFLGLKKLAYTLNPQKPLSPLLPFLVLLISGFSQTIFQYPFFMGLVFLVAAIRPISSPGSPLARQK